MKKRSTAKSGRQTAEELREDRIQEKIRRGRKPGKAHGKQIVKKPPRGDHHRPEPEGVAMEIFRRDLIVEIKRGAELSRQLDKKVRQLKQANEKLRYLKIMWPEIMVSLRSLEAMERGRNR